MKAIKLLGCAAIAAGVTLAMAGANAQSLTPLEELGKNLFFDPNLSTPPGQACAVCHAPGVGFTGPDSAINAGPTATRPRRNPHQI
jgi:cytochrome c peroxidase